MLSQASFTCALIAVVANAQYGSSSGLAGLLRPGHADAVDSFKHVGGDSYGNDDHSDSSYGNGDSSYAGALTSAYGSAPHGDSYGNDHQDSGYGNGDSSYAGAFSSAYGSAPHGDSYGNDHQDSGYGNVGYGNGDSSYDGAFSSAYGSAPHGDSYGNDDHSDSYGSAPHGDSYSSAPHGDRFGSALHGNSYGSAPHGDSYGSAPHGDRFGSAPHGDSYGSAPHGDSYGSAPHGDRFGSALHGNSYGSAPHGDSYGSAPHGDSYGNDHHDSHTGYGSSHGSSYGFPWVRRSTIRPRDVKAYNTEPVDNYYKSASKETETIRASCEFDFMGYSYSSGSLELVQKPYDLTSIIGEFEGMSPGLHSLKIHEFGDLEYGCESAGEVYNPFGSYEGQSHEDIHDRRVGDIEHIQARFDTNAEYKNRDLLVNLSGPNSVIGRSMVVYEREDDHDQTEHEQTNDREGRFIEGKGRRVACCVIGLAKGEKPERLHPSKPLHPAPQDPQLVFTQDPHFNQQHGGLY